MAAKLLRVSLPIACLASAAKDMHGEAKKHPNATQQDRQRRLTEDDALPCSAVTSASLSGLLDSPAFEGRIKRTYECLFETDGTVRAPSMDAVLLNNPTWLRPEDQYVVNLGANDGVNGDPTWDFAKSSGWTVLEVEGASSFYGILDQAADEMKKQGLGTLIVQKSLALPETLGAMYTAHGVPKTLAFLKVDIDSIDCVIANLTLAMGYRPAFIQMEHNPDMPPPFRFSPRYHKDAHMNHEYGCYGCSLQGEVDLMRRYGYRLISAVFKDAVFARADIYTQHYESILGAQLDPVIYFEAARHRLAGKCNQRKVEFTYVGKGGKKKPITVCTKKHRGLTRTPDQLPRPFSLCSGALHHAPGSQACAKFWTSMLEGARSADLRTKASTSATMRKTLTTACTRTQDMMGKLAHWGDVQARQTGAGHEALKSVPFVLDSPDQPGEFAAYFGI